MLEAAKRRSELQHRAKNNLKSTYYWVRSAQIITGILGLVLAYYVAASAYINSKLSDEVSKSEISHFFTWIDDGNVSNVIVGILGFTVSIPGQCTFPTP
jgi:hypothetical protein